MHHIFDTLHRNSIKNISACEAEWVRIHTNKNRTLSTLRLVERPETNPNIDLASDGQEINDVRDKPITAPDVKEGRDTELPAPHVLNLHPERKCIIIVQESCESPSSAFQRNMCEDQHQTYRY